MRRRQIGWMVWALVVGGALHAQVPARAPSPSGVPHGQAAVPAQEPVSFAQDALNKLAMPLTGGPPMPASFAEWTTAERNSVPLEVSGQCGVAWLVMNPGGRTRLLPRAMDSETNTLLLSVCMAGKMPRDWPGRGLALEKAKDIVQRSTALGSPLKLPGSLQ